MIDAVRVCYQFGQWHLPINYELRYLRQTARAECPRAQYRQLLVDYLRTDIEGGGVPFAHKTNAPP